MKLCGLNGYKLSVYTESLYPFSGKVNNKITTCTISNTADRDGLETNDLLENIRILLYYIKKRRKNLTINNHGRTFN
jgi:hypothetical protein